MTTRAKFEVTKVSEFGYSGSRQEIQKIVESSPSYKKYESTGIPLREITLTAVYGGSKENESFATATPSGSITFQLNNPALADEFKPGQSYYVDFTPAS